MKFLLILLSLTFSALTHAQNLTDLWSTPAESGWGLTTVHENNLLVITLYVHDAAHTPHWYTAALTRYGNTNAGDPEFSGELFESTGSRIGDPWIPANVTRRRVGAISFRARPQGSAELEYAVDGVHVFKRIQRFTTQAERLDGLHYASLLPGYESCATGFEGLRVFERGTLSIERCNEDCDYTATSPQAGTGGSPIHMLLNDGAREICSIDGTFLRYGRSGGIQGTYSCSDGGSGAIEFKDIEFTSLGFNARFSATHPSCQSFTGILSGVRASAR